MLATRLETIVSKYNSVMKSLSEFEQPLFERSLAKIDHVSDVLRHICLKQSKLHTSFVLQLFDQGLNTYTWRTDESHDFIETANALVCVDLHRNLDIVQTSCQDIALIASSWGKATLDVFQARKAFHSYTIEQLVEEQL